MYERKETGYLFLLSAVLNRIFSYISTGDTQEGSGGGYTEAAISYIKQNLSDASLSVEDLAKSLGVSVAHLRRKFHQVLGMSPKQYIDKLRMETARMLIETGFYSQAEIAERCGFGDVDYFRTVFKRKNGVTVRAYRKREET